MQKALWLLSREPKGCFSFSVILQMPEFAAPQSDLYKSGFRSPVGSYSMSTSLAAKYASCVADMILRGSRQSPI